MKKQMLVLLLSTLLLSGCGEIESSPLGEASSSFSPEVLPNISRECLWLNGSVSKKTNGYFYFDYTYEDQNLEAVLSHCEVILKDKVYEPDDSNHDQALEQLVGKKALGYWIRLYLQDTSGLYFSSATSYAAIATVKAAAI